MRQILLLSATFILLAVFCVVDSGCGGGGGGAAPPAAVSPGLSVTQPRAGDQVSDVDFRAENFYIEITHAAPLNMSSFSVHFSMDGGTAQDITSYFSDVNATTLRSGNLYQFTRTLFVLASNDHSRNMFVSVSAESTTGVAGTATRSFVVYPVAPPSH